MKKEEIRVARPVDHPSSICVYFLMLETRLYSYGIDDSCYNFNDKTGLK